MSEINDFTGESEDEGREIPKQDPAQVEEPKDIDTAIADWIGTPPLPEKTGLLNEETPPKPENLPASKRRVPRVLYGGPPLIPRGDTEKETPNQ